MTYCECEHTAHFGGISLETPNHPKHKYGATFPHNSTTPVKTTWGTFYMCEDCKKAYEEYERERGNDYEKSCYVTCGNLYKFVLLTGSEKWT